MGHLHLVDGFDVNSGDSNPLSRVMLKFREQYFDALKVSGVPTIGVPFEFIVDYESTMQKAISNIYDALPEYDQLRIYQFFLISVRLSSISSTRFNLSILMSAEKNAYLEAEFDDLVIEQESLIDDIACNCVDCDDCGENVRRLASLFVWSMAWWMYGRRDEDMFISDPSIELPALLLLGRRPKGRSGIAASIYAEALSAESAYRGKQPSKKPSVTHVLRVSGGHL